MKKLILLLLFIPLVSFGQLTYEEENAIASEIFETFNENYIKQSALEFLRLDDKAIAMAQKNTLTLRTGKLRLIIKEK